MKFRHSILFVGISLLLLLTSCAPKIYLQEADKLRSEKDISEIDDIRIDTYFTGDALEYLVFELDAFNNSDDTLILDHNNIQLVLLDPSGDERVFNALNKRKVISELEQYHEEVKLNNKARNISNAVGIGLNIILIGNYSNNVGLDLALYASESAAYMLEDNRAHKLLSGSIEEQIDYVNEWVLEKDSIPPGGDNSWDVLFPRRLLESNAQLDTRIGESHFIQSYRLYIREEKLR